MEESANHHGWREEGKTLAKLALPTIVMTASQQAMVFTDQVMIGHLGTEQMAAAALGNMYSAILQYFLFGTATALDTLGATAYGAQRKGLPGTSLVTWCYTSFVVLTVLSVPASVGLLNAWPIAKLLRQDDHISELMSEFCAGLVPGVGPMMWSIVLIKYLQVQNVVISPAFGTLATFFMNIGLNFGFIAAFGFRGAPMATSFSRIIQFIFMSILVACFQRTKGTQRTGVLALLFSDADSEEDVSAEGQVVHHHNFANGHHHNFANHATDQKSNSQGDQGAGQGTSGVAGGSPQGLDTSGRQSGVLAAVRLFGWNIVKGSQPSLLWAYLKLGIPGGVMMSCEQVSFDITTSMAGQLGAAVVAAHSAFLNIIGLTFVSCPFAVGIAGSIRVGNLLGSGQPYIARMSAWLCVAVGGMFMAFFAFIILVARDYVGFVFTNERAVVSVMASIAPLAALFQVSDGVMGTAQGVLRGCGKQTILMVYNFVGFWLCGVLLGALLCFQAGMGVIGLWWGIASGDTVTGILNIATLYRVDWPEESKKAQQTLAQAVEQNQGDPDAQEETDALIPGRGREPRSAGKQEMVRV
ncbi:mate-domain-containing protein [Dunaliella salina]|uniref:Protein DETOXIFICATION n=1 Tax=Dunaliella salina TaxID=3046 RepID=A0ABQ7GEV5_DUNSA|nr:mate-domain-containing protein [Dunaliella salina]|eukprot:KAF5833124.1 mate-domain-containing protein [Dunaliella salina]